MQDEELMKRVLELAIHGQGSTSPNPMVGAIILDKNGIVVGEGYHEKPGLPHAEINALAKCGERALNGTLYVNLEPCCHFGRTHPCVDAIIKSGIKKVVVGCIDTNPKVNGLGIERLKQASIEVTTNVLKNECQHLNIGFFKLQATKMPWLTLKLASTLDGKIADFQGTSKYISCSQSLEFVHKLRANSDCVMIGGKTFNHDKSQLNVRLVPFYKQPDKVILDTNLMIDPNYNFKYESNAKTYILCSAKAYEARANLYSKNLTLVKIPSNQENNKLDLTECLKFLGSIDKTYVLCEGGGLLAGALLANNLIDEIYWIIAPKLLVDSSAVSSLNISTKTSLNDTMLLYKAKIIPQGNDFIFNAFTRQNYDYLK